MLTEDDRLEAALEALRAQERDIAALGWATPWTVDLELLTVLVRSGRWDEARAVASGVLVDDLTPEDRRSNLGVSAAWAALLWARSGDLDLADRAVGVSRAATSGAIQAHYVEPLTQAEGELALLRLRPQQAVAAAERGLAILADTVEEDALHRLHGLRIRALGQVAASRRRGDHAAVEVLEAALATMRNLDAARSARRAMGGRSIGALLAEAAAEGASAGSSRDAAGDASDLWAEAASLWSGIGEPHRVAHARLREAEACLVRGFDRHRAESSLREAHRIAIRLAARPLAEDIRGLARRARIALPAEGPDEQPEPSGPAREAPEPVVLPGDPHGLTDREHEVLELLAAGRTNREIGEALFISPKTAGVHVSNILGKLGAANRVEAASIAYRLQLIDPGRR